MTPDSPTETTRRFQRELNAGTTSLAILALLGRSGEPMYGYQIARLLQEAAGEGLLKQGTIYPLLRTMESRRLLSSAIEPSQSGPPRRYYTITDEGRETLALWAGAWRRTARFVDEMLAGAGGAGPGGEDD